PSLLITSPSRGDGKTDVAANLAVSFARAGKKVILIDANLRRPQLAAIFGIPEKGGLSSLFESRDRLPEPVAISSIPGLSILPAGTTTPSSSEILGSQRMYELLQTCKARADLVIIDSPSLWYSDTLALAPQVDGVLLTVSSGTTGRETTISAVESLRLVGANIIGTVLNRVKAGPAYQYYPSFAASRPALEGPTATNPVRALNSGSASSTSAQAGKSSTQSTGGALGKSQPAAPTASNTSAKNATVVLDAMTPDAPAPSADWAPVEPVATYANGAQPDTSNDPNASRSNQNRKK
ncbi:polysaccharide biosynthesis tyrosine autokinase, partial [Kouleothrix sp.]|uniref:CpsD/CapB family tyrosine-protein kinase n=1 Tax=Kouleothrix sp. TaxID=2779161 RepID=UPI00391D1195